MDKILRLSVPDGDITVQPGVKWEDLNLYLKNKGVPLFFPLDPGPGATIGGMCGTGCSGTNAVRYGTAKAEWFLNLVSERPKVASGYNIYYAHSSHPLNLAHLTYLSYLRFL